ncbi:MAG: tRNA lysidine(34) synthetase TilS [Oscillospiraceae bacterium]
MLNKIEDTISKYGMLSNGDNVYVGLSGGADSVSLLVALHQLKDLYGIKLHAIHINHQLRGDESLRDENFCIELCNRLNVPLNIKRIDVKSYCEDNKLSTEEGARILRYEVFKELSNGKVATAHTLSDNCETIIYNLTRGTGLKGLTGIPPIRDNIIRPLIQCTRTEVETFLKSQNFGYVTDSTNLSNDYTRNKIRHKVIPVLKEINPQFEKKVLDTVLVLSKDNNFIDSLVDEIYNTSSDGKTLNVDIRPYDVAIRHRCIAKFFKLNHLEYSKEKILSTDDIILKDGKINVTKDVYLVAKLGILSIIETPNTIKNDDISPIDLPINGECKLFNKTIKTHLRKNIGFINKKLTYYIMDYDKIQGKALARGRVFGDKIQLKGRRFTSSVKKLINENIPKEDRPNLCFICDDVGLIFMERFGIAERVACDKLTQNYLTIEIVNEN